MNKINPYSIAPFIASILLFSIGLFVYLKDRRSKVHRMLFLLTASTFVWLFGYAVLYSINSESSALLCVRILFTSVIFIPVFFHHFCVSYFKIENNSFPIRISYILGICFTALLWGTDGIIGIQKYFWGYYAKAGRWHNIYLAFFILCFGRCLYLLWAGSGYNGTSKIPEAEANRTRYLFWAFVVSTIASLDFLPFYGVGFYPIGFLFMSGWVIITAYAIVRHQLLEIEVVIKKTLVFAGLFAAIYAVFAGFTFLGQVVFEEITGGNRWVSLIPSIVIIVLILRPLENFLVRVTDRYLFQKEYDYKELLKTFTNEVLTVLDLDRLVRLTVNKLTDIIKLTSCGVLLLDREKDVYRLVASQGIKGKEVALSRESTLPGFLKRVKTYLLIQEHGRGYQIPVRVLDDINRLKLELAIPLVLHEDMIGILTLGKKKSDEGYNKDDLDILMPLAKTLAIAVSNAELFVELSETQAEASQREKMAVIGTLSAGINHEICNPLGIARGQCEAFLLNLRDGLYKNKNNEELLRKAQDIMEKVIKETDRATVITKKLSSFARPTKGVVADDVNMKEEIGEVLSLVGYELKLDKINLAVEMPEDLSYITADKKQIQEIFFNLIRNAAQSIVERGVITIGAREENDLVCIEISDTGHGIPKDKMGQIFNPFYTTKEPGKGTGLGLFIVRQIIERNNGKISVKSKVGEGTTFTLEFPTSVKARV